jgi:uncharacterized delta-60 repeat protein
MGGVAILTAANDDLDLSFGVGGRVLTDFGGTDDEGRAVAVDTDGRIVVAGWGYSGSDLDLRLARYNPDGSLDSTFGLDGKVTGPELAAEDVAIDRDGRIVVFGWRWVGSDFGTTVARFIDDGTPDSSFGAGGRIETPCNRTTFSGGVVIDRNDRILVAGTAATGTTTVFCLARYNHDGSPDTTFGAGGLATAPFSGAADGRDVAIGPLGDIVVAGTVGEFVQGSYHEHVALARFTGTGSLDASFGSLGIVEGPRFAAYDGAYDVTIDQQDRAVVVGYAGDESSHRDILVARYTANGALDSDFDGDGWVVVEATADPNHDIFAAGVAIDNLGRIVAAGYLLDSVDANFTVIRLVDNGTLDTTFGVGGEVQNHFGGVSAAAALAIDANGLIVVAGTSNSPAMNRDFGIARLQSRRYTFSGFLSPIEDAPAFNVIKAGRAVPVKFSLNGNQGLDILAAGSPTSHPIACASAANVEVIPEALIAATSSLSYDATTDQYTYVWKTDKAWASSCRQLVVTLNDGSTHVANFQLSR